MATITKTNAKLEMVEASSELAAKALLADLESHHTKPLWAQMNKLNPPSPNPTAIPHVWRYDMIRPHLLRAGELIAEKQAERRVAMLVNPARGKCPCIIAAREPTNRRDKLLPLQQILFMLVCSWSCRMRLLRHIVTRHLPCGSL
jgi:gentisate 1,2-dioxygenase